MPANFSSNSCKKLVEEMRVLHLPVVSKLVPVASRMAAKKET